MTEKTPTPEAAAYNAGWDAGKAGLPDIPPLYLDKPDLRKRLCFGWWDAISGSEPQPERTEYHVKSEEEQ